MEENPKGLSSVCKIVTRVFWTLSKSWPLLKFHMQFLCKITYVPFDNPVKLELLSEISRSNRNREIKQLAWGFTATKWQNQVTEPLTILLCHWKWQVHRVLRTWNNQCASNRYNILLLNHTQNLLLLEFIICKVRRFPLEQLALPVTGVKILGCLDWCGIRDWLCGVEVPAREQWKWWLVSSHLQGERQESKLIGLEKMEQQGPGCSRRLKARCSRS